MSNKQDFEGITKEAKQEIWKIIISLLTKKVDIDTIFSVLTFNREELEDVKRTMQEDPKRIAINLAKDAHMHNLTPEYIEKTTGVESSVFIKYMKEEVVERNNGQLGGGKAKNKIKPRIKPRGKTTRLPDDYKSPISKENERLLKLLRRL